MHFKKCIILETLHKNCLKLLCTFIDATIIGFIKNDLCSLHCKEYFSIEDEVMNIFIIIDIHKELVFHFA